MFSSKSVLFPKIASIMRAKNIHTHTLTIWSSKVFLRIRRYFSFKFHALSSLCFLNAWLVTNRMVRFSNVFYVLLRSIQRDLISIRFSSNSENKSNSMLSTTTDVSVILICRCFFLRNKTVLVIINERKNYWHQKRSICSPLMASS